MNAITEKWRLTKRSRTVARVRPVIQHTLEDCGPACLAMVLNYFGHWVTLAHMRDQCGTGRDGTSLLVLRDVARQHGLEAVGRRVPANQLSTLPLPAILHWGGQHLVILEAIGPTHVSIMDPGVGRLRLSWDHVSRAYSGVAMTFRPTEHFVQVKRPSLLKQYLRFFVLPPKRVAQLALLSVFLYAAGLAGPLLVGRLLDNVVVAGNADLLPILGWGILVLAGLQGLLAYISTRVETLVRISLDQRLMTGFVEKLFRLPYGFFELRSTGDLVMRSNTNVYVRDYMSKLVVSVLGDGTLLVLYTLFLLSMSAHIALLVLVLGLVQVAFMVGAWPRIHRLSRQEISAQSQSQSYLTEAIRGIASLKIAGAEERATKSWRSLFDSQLAASRGVGMASAKVGGMLTIIGSLAPLAGFWLAGREVLDGKMSPGGAMAVYVMGALLLTALKNVISVGQGLQTLVVHLDRLCDVTDASAPSREGLPPLPGRLAGGIRLQDVSFAYSSSSPPVLREINLELQPGERVALVGPSGSGKSSLTALLVGLYAPSAGEIFFDSYPLSQINPSSLRGQMGVVLQGDSVFGATVRENIALHDPDLTLEEITAAAQTAAIHSDIAAMPMGYDTVLGEGGSSLSGGQRQRLALARALAHKPAILVLDEATSNLDTITERLINQNLNRLSCTRIIIAHRLSTVVDADRIIVLSQGRVAGMGTHNQLLHENSVYRQLVEAQLAEPAGVPERG